MTRTLRLATTLTGAAVLVACPAMTTVVLAASPAPVSRPARPAPPRADPATLYATLPERLRPSSTGVAATTTSRVYFRSGQLLA